MNSTTVEKKLTKEEQWVLKEKYGGLRNTHFERDRARLATGEPVAYVIGWQPFLGLKIYLDSHPLIPRPETEWWVEQLLEEVSSSLEGGSGARRREAQQIFSKKLCVSREGAADLRCLDLCAGSGAIGCVMLAAFPTAEVYFSEIDPEHTGTIEKNITMNPPSLKLRRAGGLGISRAHIGVGDLFTPFGSERFDVIACNPPYIPSGRTLPASVAHFEPAKALYAGADGLALIRRIAEELPRRLNPGGIAWIECDSSHAQAAKSLFEAAGLSADIRTDQYGAPRVLVVSLP